MSEPVSDSLSAWAQDLCRYLVYDSEDRGSWGEWAQSLREVIEPDSWTESREERKKVNNLVRSLLSPPKENKLSVEEERLLGLPRYKLPARKAPRSSHRVGGSRSAKLSVNEADDSFRDWFQDFWSCFFYSSDKEGWKSWARDLYRCFVYDSNDEGSWRESFRNLCQWVGPNLSVEKTEKSPEKLDSIRKPGFSVDDLKPEDYLIETLKLQEPVRVEVAYLMSTGYRALARKVALVYLARKMGASIFAGCLHVDREILVRLQRQYFEVLKGKEGALEVLRATIGEANVDVFKEVKTLNLGIRDVKRRSEEALRSLGIIKKKPIKPQLKRQLVEGPKNFLCALERVATYMQRYLYDQKCPEDDEILKWAQQEWGASFADLMTVEPSERPILGYPRGEGSVSTERTQVSCDQSGGTEILEVGGVSSGSEFPAVHQHLAKCLALMNFLSDNLLLGGCEKYLLPPSFTLPTVEVSPLPKERRGEFLLQKMAELVDAADFVALQVLEDLEKLDDTNAALEAVWNKDDPISYNARVLPKVCDFIRMMEENWHGHIQRLGKNKYVHSKEVAQQRWEEMRACLGLESSWKECWDLDIDPFRDWRERENEYNRKRSEFLSISGKT